MSVLSRFFGIESRREKATMSEQQTPLTYEGILEMFRQTDLKFQETALQMKETDRKFQETDRIIQETALQMKETDRKFQETDRKFQESARQLKETQREIGKLGSSVGRIIEHMVKGKILKKFQALGYDVTLCCPNLEFEIEEQGIVGEIDLLLDDGPVSILIEVKTTLKTDDIRDHIERIGKYRRYVEAKGFGDQRRFIGAVAGAVVSKETAQFAHDHGLYVIVQSGEAVEIIASPEGFRAKEW